MDWIQQISPMQRSCIYKSLLFCKDFSGFRAVTGSSANKKYPVGDDIDIALIGYGSKDAHQYIYELSQKVLTHMVENIQGIRLDNLAIDSFEYPLIKEA